MTPEASTTPAARPPASAKGGSLRFAAGLFLAGVLITAVLLIVTGGGTTVPRRAAPPPPAPLPKLTEQFYDRALGVTGLTTRRWVVGGVGPILHLISVDRKVVIAVDAPGAAQKAHAALHAAIDVIRKLYRNVTLNQALPGPLGGRPSISVVMYGTNAKGTRVRTLVASATGRKLTYVMEVSAPVNAPLVDLEEAQEIIATLRFNN